MNASKNGTIRFTSDAIDLQTRATCWSLIFVASSCEMSCVRLTEAGTHFCNRCVERSPFKSAVIIISYSARTSVKTFLGKRSFQGFTA